MATSTNSDSSANPYDLFVVGLGMVGPRQITREVDAALRSCREVLFIHHDAALHEYMSERYGNVTDLDTSYVEGAKRERIYDTMAERVIESARSNPPAAFAAYGHPWVYVRPTRLILDRCREQGLTAKVLPGISALDGLLADLELDPGHEGLQMYEATDLLLRRRPLQADVPCLLWQVGAIGSLQHDTSGVPAHRFEWLRDFLLQFYHAGHVATLARTPSIPAVAPHQKNVSIKNLPDFASSIGSADTLYIPSVVKRRVQDREVLEESARP